MNVKKFLNVSKRHVTFEEAIATLLHKLIDWIMVHEAKSLDPTDTAHCAGFG